MRGVARSGRAKLAVQVVVIAKEPRPGAVKTRLCPPLTPEQAAELAEAALADTCRVIAGTGAQFRVMALEGRPGPWMPPGCDLVVHAREGSASAWRVPSTTPGRSTRSRSS